MHRLLVAWCALAGLATCTVPARADDQAEMKQLLAKALKAQGGADNMAKVKAASAQMKGKFYGLGDAIDYTGTFSHQDPDKVRTEIEASVNGMAFKTVQIINGDKGWFTVNDMVMDMTKEMVDEAKEHLYTQQVTHLVVLSGKGYKLSPLGESKVEGKDAVGMRVESKGRRDVNLFFDKKTGLLLKSETREKDVQGGGDKEYTAETLYSDYKKVGNVLHAHKVAIKRDGKLFVTGEISELKIEDKLDAALFAKP
jgi:outer membrane lipoprotein-sorting protein